MAYVGQGIKGGTFSVLDTSGNTYNGSNVTFDLGTQVGSPAQLLVSHDGVIQKPVTDYTIATGGTQITFTTAPASGASIFITEISGAVGAPMNRDINGDELILDADADTSITADTDDQIDIRIAGADDFQFTANTFTAQAGSTITTPTLGVVSAHDLGAGLHVKISDAGAISGGLNTDGDDLVVEHSGSGGMSIITGTSSQGGIYFGDSGDADIGVIRYDHANNSLDFFTSGTERANFDTNGKLTLLVGAQTQENLEVIDDKGVVFGTGGDWMIAAAPGESTLEIYNGSTNATGTNEGQIQFRVGDSAETYINVLGGEGNIAQLYLYADQGDDAADKNYIYSAESGSTNAGLHFGSVGGGSRDDEMFIANDVITCEHSITTASVDYAEFFEWKTELANDDKIKETYGMTVVLDGDKIRLAEAGEEAKVLGVVRPNNTSTIIGGQGIKWHDKYKKDMWGEYEEEGYTQVTWQIKNADGEIIKRHSYMKDRIPQYELITRPDETAKEWYKEDKNFLKDDSGNKITLSVPSTAKEKSDTNYQERTHRKNNSDIPLKRRIFNDSFDESKTYVPRSKRRKEWCVVGLIGQVPVRDTAVIPTSWNKMKNVGTGVDLYYIK